MADLQNPKLIWLKGWLFLLGGLLASAGILLEAFSWKLALLLVIAVWCFCRFYYFAFYVIEHYVDPGYKFAGLWDFVKYALGMGHDSKEAGRQETPARKAAGDS